MGEDIAALSGQARGSWAAGQERAMICASGIVDRAHRSPRRDLPAGFGRWMSRGDQDDG